MTGPHTPDAQPPKEPTRGRLLVMDCFEVVFDTKGVEAPPQPKDWEDVACRIKSHLMSIAESSVGLLAETISSLRVLVRGIGNIPPAVAKRIERAHESTESRAKLGSQVRDEAPLEVQLARIRKNGVEPRLVQHEDGSFVITLLTRPPETVICLPHSHKSAGATQSDSVPDKA
jgi:hypothetical protein